MADIMAVIANIGVLKILGAILIVGLLIAAFAIGGGSKGGKGGNGGGNSNNQSNNGGNA